MTKVLFTRALAVLGATVLISAPSFAQSWSDMTTATTTAYCLAKHPVQTALNRFTDDGYEMASANPAIVGAVRRNFIYGRDPNAMDDETNTQNRTCSQACGEMGKLYGPTYKGEALTHLVGNTPVASGLGDIAALVMEDKDFYLGKRVVSGIWTRVQSFQESDVAQADMCCCHVIPTPAP